MVLTTCRPLYESKTFCNVFYGVVCERLITSSFSVYVYVPRTTLISTLLFPAHNIRNMIKTSIYLLNRDKFTENTFNLTVLLTFSKTKIIAIYAISYKITFE